MPLNGINFSFGGGGYALAGGGTWESAIAISSSQVVSAGAVAGGTLAGANVMYLSVKSHIKAFDLAKEGVKITNQAVEIAINDTTELEDIIYSAISVNEHELAQKHSERFLIIDSIIKGDYDKAKKFVLELPDDVDESREVYYVHDKFLKQLYLALLNKDEVLFNQELIKRIKKYRRNMVGYSTYIDVVSISMIKFARKLGMDYNFDIVEIPKYFLDENVQADKEKYKLPEV